MAGRAGDHLDELLAGLTALVGRPATAEDRRGFQQYLDVFIRWNRVHRMTALDAPGQIVRNLFVDSLLLFALLPPRPLRIVDIGAGAGIPGIPLRLADPGIALTLVESRRKRVSFLLAACRELGLSDVTVKEGRAEVLVNEDSSLSNAFDVVVTRAVGPIATLVPIGLRYLRPGGLLIASGPPSARRSRAIEVVRVAVPGGGQPRSFLRARKESNVPRET